MCNLRFVRNVKDGAVSTVRQQSMCSPWTHCLTPNSPDFAPSDFFVSWGTFCAFSTLETHNLHANITVHFTQITSETLTDRLEELAPGWDISFDCVRSGAHVARKLSRLCGLHVPNIKQQNGRYSVLQRLTFFSLPKSVHIFVFSRHLKYIRYIVVSYGSIFLGFIHFRRSVCKIMSVFKYSTQVT